MQLIQISISEILQMLQISVYLCCSNCSQHAYVYFFIQILYLMQYYECIFLCCIFVAMICDDNRREYEGGFSNLQYNSQQYHIWTIGRLPWILHPDYCRVYVPQIWGYSSHYCIPQIWGYSLHYCTTDMELQLTLLYHRYRLQSSHGVIFLLPYPAQCTLIHVYESGTHVSAYQLISH